MINLFDEFSLCVLLSEFVKSTPRAVPHKSCSPANPSWLGDLEEIRSSLEILAV